MIKKIFLYISIMLFPLSGYCIDTQAYLDSLQKRLRIDFTIDDDKVSVDISEKFAKNRTEVVGDAELDQLVPVKDKIVSIHLSSSKITKAGYLKLKLFTNLQSLDIESSTFDDACGVGLSDLSNLTSLGLKKTKITKTTLEKVCSVLNLQSLDISYSRISDADLAIISKMKQLRFLILTGTNVSDEGLSYLDNMVNLEGVVLKKTKVTSKGAARLFQKIKSHNKIEPRVEYDDNL